MQNQDFPHKNPQFWGQSGNALWFILVAIALLTALTLALTRNSGKMADNLSSEQARIVAQQAVRDFNEYTGAIQKVMQFNNCSESQISFETNFVSPTSTYTNTKAPTDKRCHIFEAAGAGLAPRNKPAGMQDKSKVPVDSMWKFTGDLSVNFVGPEAEGATACSSNCAELVVGDVYIDAEVCRQYNLLMRFNNGTAVAPIGTPDWTVPFTGTYGAGTAGNKKIMSGPGPLASSLNRRSSACFYTLEGSYRNHQIYHVLLIR